MSNQFTGIGNVGTAPTLRNVQVGGEPRDVVEVRVYFDRRVRKGDGYEDKGGFWLTVSYWGAQAGKLAEVVQKGARVQVAGSLRQETWNDRESGEARNELRLTAETITIVPMCIESLTYRKRGGNDGGNAGGHGQAQDGHIPYDGEDIAF